MRLDIFLKSSRLIPRRTLAQKFCDADLVTVNDNTAKSSHSIKEGDQIEIKKHNRLIKVRVLEVPKKKQVSKQNAENLYEVISSEELKDDLFEKK